MMMIKSSEILSISSLFFFIIHHSSLDFDGADIKVEGPTNIRRLDAILETETKIHIMEFKIGKEQEALEQIKRMKYHEKYLNTGKEIVLLGIGFDPYKRNIGNYVIETFNV